MQPRELTLSAVKIPGTERFLIQVNGVLTELPGRSMRLLALLALARAGKGSGWLQVDDCYGADNIYAAKEVWRLRMELRKQSPKAKFGWVKWEVVERGKKGEYRLLIAGDKIQIPDDLCEQFDDADVTKAFKTYQTQRRNDEKKRATGAHPWRERIILGD